jgi:hypothetical protein
MLASTTMNAAGITESDVQDTLLTDFGRRKWDAVKVVVGLMSMECKAWIISQAIATGSPDTSTRPNRYTSWSKVNPIMNCHLEHDNGSAIIDNVATAVVLAAIWDILYSKKTRKE